MKDEQGNSYYNILQARKTLHGDNRKEHRNSRGLKFKDPRMEKFIMNSFTYNENINNSNVLDKFTSACRNYVHHSIASDYVRHRTYKQTLADHMQLPSRTLHSISQLVRSRMEFIFSTNGVIQ